MKYDAKLPEEVSRGLNLPFVRLLRTISMHLDQIVCVSFLSYNEPNV